MNTPKSDNLKKRSSGQRRDAAFTALKHPNFRAFWFGQTISLCGTWMQTVAQGWLVFRLTNSPFWLTAVGAASNMPVLFFSLFGGVIADRLSKRTLLVFTQTASAILAFSLGTLVWLGTVKVWQIIFLAAMLGLVNAFDTPARQSFIIDMVGREDLPNALALHSFIFHASRVVGPAIAGALIGIFDISLSFYLNALSYVPVIIVLSFMRVENRKPARQAGSIWEDLSSGLKFVYRQREIRELTSLVAVTSLFALPYTSLMPAFARNILGLGAKGYGALMSVVGVGALCGASFLALTSNYPRKRLVVAWSILCGAACLGIFAFSGTLWLSVPALLVIGFCFVSGIAGANIILQSMVPDELRGRVMSVFTLMLMGMVPVGNLIIGAMAQAWGSPAAVGIGSGICLLAAVRFRMTASGNPNYS